MTDDERDRRDRYVPKHPTPPTGTAIRRTSPHGVPIPPAPMTIDVRSHVDEHRQIRQETSPISADFDGDTPVGATGSVMLAHVAARSKASSVAAYDVQGRMATLETSMRNDMTQILVAVADLKGSVATMVTENAASRTERVERERRAETRAEEQAKRDHDYRRRVLLVIVPILTAIGGIVAGIVASGV